MKELDEKRSVTVEEYEEKYKPLLNTAIELVNTHQDIPEEIDQGEVLSALIMLGNELTAGLNNRVPEVVKLQEEIDRKNKTITKLQDTNQQFMLRLGKAQDQTQQQHDANKDKPKKSYAEIKAIIDGL